MRVIGNSLHRSHLVQYDLFIARPCFQNQTFFPVRIVCRLQSFTSNHLTILEDKEYLEAVQAGYFNIIMVRTGDQGKTTLEKMYTR